MPRQAGTEEKGGPAEKEKGFVLSRQSCHLQEHETHLKSFMRPYLRQRGNQITAERENVWAEKREKALTGLSMSAVRAGLGPGVRQPRQQRGLPGVSDHASITMSQVGHAAKRLTNATELPC